MIYPPSDDSYLLQEKVKNYLRKLKNKKIRILDIGSGSGIQAQSCKSLGFDNILLSDVDDEPLKLLKKKGFRTIKSNIFSNITSKQRFDLIIFNPPYLPEDKREPSKSKLSTTGGKKGDEIILRFLKNVKNYLNKNGIILIVLSSLTPKTRINNLINKLNLKKEMISHRKLFMETLEVWKIKRLLNNTNS